MKYMIMNGAVATSVSQEMGSVPEGIRTLLQVKGVAGVQLRISEWGISFNGSAADTPVRCELMETGTVFATVTAHNYATDLVKYDNPNNPTSTTYFALGTAATGYNASAEGSITAGRVFDAQMVAPTNQYVKQFPLGQEPVINVGTSMRIRVTAGAAVNAYCYMTIEI